MPTFDFRDAGTWVKSCWAEEVISSPPRANRGLTGEKIMKRTVSVLLSSVLAVGAITTAVFAQQPKLPPPDDWHATGRYLPEYTSDGALVLPKNFHEWVYVGSPLTPNILNNGKANFPEFHNVYIEPGSYEIYRKTGVFPEGTIFVKELQLMLPADRADGSRLEPSGRGFFPGPFNGADVTVKDTKRYTETNGWGYYNFNHFEPKAATATVRPLEECAYCHIASAKRDDVWTQFYGLLDSVPVPADQKKK
jgi:Cytochrome P460